MGFNVRGMRIVTSDWVPILGDTQRVNVAAASTRSTALTVGRTYAIVSNVDCWLAAGGATVDAVVGDGFKLIAGVYAEYTCELDTEVRIAVIADSLEAVNGLAICRVSRQ